MKTFVCPSCGRKSYSSAELADQKDPRCPYCGFNMRGPRVTRDVVSIFIFCGCFIGIIAIVLAAIFEI